MQTAIFHMPVIQTSTTTCYLHGFAALQRHALLLTVGGWNASEMEQCTSEGQGKDC